MATAAAQSATFHHNKTMASDTNVVLEVHDQKADSNHRETSTAATTTRLRALTPLELAADSDPEVHQAAMALLEPDPDSEVARVDLVVLVLTAALVHSDFDLIVAHEIAAVLIKPR